MNATIGFVRQPRADSYLWFLFIVLNRVSHVPFLNFSHHANSVEIGDGNFPSQKSPHPNHFRPISHATPEVNCQITIPTAASQTPHNARLVT